MKTFIFTLTFICLLTTGAFGQMINTRSYAEIFGFRNANINIGNRYVVNTSDDDHNRFGNLSGEYLDTVDTPLEFALLSYYSPSVLQIRPEQANAILPANNPRLSDQKLGAAVFQEIQILRFLNDTAAENRHEAVLQYIIGRGNATRAQIETFYRDNVRAMISQVVDEDFNKISFSLRKDNRIGYNAVLTRNPQNGQYLLTYGGIETNDVMRTVTGNSVDALLTAMLNGTNKNDFSQLSIDTVRAQAALIPAVALPVSYRNNAVNVITAFYLDPNQSTFRELGIQYRRFLLNDEDKGRAASSSFIRAIGELNPVIADRV